MLIRLSYIIALHKNEKNKKQNIENVMLVGLAILKPAKSTQTSAVWMAQHTIESSRKVAKTIVPLYACTSLGHLDL